MDLVEKVGNMHEQIGEFSRERKTRKKELIQNTRIKIILSDEEFNRCISELKDRSLEVTQTEI